ncbi:MAG TPA: type II asparaginase [Smithellaceae bacterium]|nr:type II asparaginase [Smithellaceae bacterium]
MIKIFADKLLPVMLVLLSLPLFFCGNAGAAENQNALPRVVVLAVGGTIAGSGDTAARTTEYKAGVLPVSQIIKSVPGINKIAVVTGEQIANIDSAHMTNEIMLKLARRINALLKDNQADGIVVTHGTDTLEETAYFLNLVIRSDRPVVLTGSMRPATALSADGQLNLYNAVVLAASYEARGKGVLVAINEKIHGARDVTKTHTTNVDTFRSPESGSLGFILNGEVHFLNATVKRHTAGSEFSTETIRKLPRVDILYGHANDSGDLAEASLKAGARGIVIAGAGDGGIFPETYAALKKARKKGVIIVRSTHVGSGYVAPCADDEKDEFLTSQTLNPQKARILLMLALTKTKNLKLIRRMFSEY